MSLFFVLYFSLIIPPQKKIQTSQTFHKQDFYKGMLSENLIEVNALFISTKTVSLPDRDAYEGALLMKKSDLIDNKKTKLSLFRTGKQKLDSTILENDENCEFRLLRLMIQENAPQILGYNKQINEDCILIKKKFSSSTVLLQNIILDYSKKSKKLKLADFSDLTKQTGMFWYASKHLTSKQIKWMEEQNVFFLENGRVIKDI